MNNQNINKIEGIIGYQFKNKDLIKQAFTHSSYANENNVSSYERLEFLGDSVLETITSFYLYSNYNNTEGVLFMTIFLMWYIAAYALSEWILWGLKKD